MHQADAFALPRKAALIHPAFDQLSVDQKADTLIRLIGSYVDMSLWFPGGKQVSESCPDTAGVPFASP